MKRTRRLGGAMAALGLAACVAALGTACAKSESHAPPPAAAAQDAGAIVDVEVMAFLSEARALHHEANIREDEGDLPGAITVLRRLVGAPRPHPDQRVPEVEEVLADAWARIAELELKVRDLDGAEKAVGEGLAHAPEPTYFRGHLLEVQGIVEESRGAELADAGKKQEAQNARARAIELLHQAVQVQEQVIGRALDGGNK